VTRKPRPPKPDPLPHNYICSRCATARGGKWPRGHAATWHSSGCPYCKASDGFVANVGDWNWPDRKARGMRD